MPVRITIIGAGPGGNTTATYAARLGAEVVLIERDIVVDFRRPDLIRIGLSPLTTRFVDVWNAVDVLVTLAT